MPPPDHSHEVTLGEVYRLTQRIDRRMDDLVTRGEHQTAMRRADEKHEAVVSEVKELEAKVASVRSQISEQAEASKNRKWAFAGTVTTAVFALIIALIGMLGNGVGL